MKKNNEIITPAQLEAKGISRVYLSRMEEEGIIERIDRGIYATKDFKYDEYYVFIIAPREYLNTHNEFKEYDNYTIFRRI